MTMVIDLAKNLKKHKYTKFAALNIIINVIIYLMSATNSGVFMPSIMELEPLSIIGILRAK